MTTVVINSETTMQSCIPTIDGLYEAHITVSDLDRSIRFYRDIIGLDLGQVFENRRVAFFWVGGKTTGMLGIWEVGTAPMRMTQHFAFKTPIAAQIEACKRLPGQGVTPLDFDGAATTEPCVIGWMPSAQVYLQDPDGHSVELLHMLDEAPDPEFGHGPLSAWRAQHPAA